MIVVLIFKDGRAKTFDNVAYFVTDGEKVYGKD